MPEAEHLERLVEEIEGHRLPAYRRQHAGLAVGRLQLRQPLFDLGSPVPLDIRVGVSLRRHAESTNVLLDLVPNRALIRIKLAGGAGAKDHGFELCSADPWRQ